MQRAGSKLHSLPPPRRPQPLSPLPPAELPNGTPLHRLLETPRQGQGDYGVPVGSLLVRISAPAAAPGVRRDGADLYRRVRSLPGEAAGAGGGVEPGKSVGPWGVRGGVSPEN